MIDFYDYKKFIINRFDLYYKNVNSKGRFYVTINTFLIGGIVTGHSFLDSSLGFSFTHKLLFNGVVVLALTSIALAILAINPFLKSNNSQKYQSLLFFDSIAKMKEKEFIEDFQQIKEEAISSDMIQQIYILAKGLSKKYCLLKWSGYVLSLEFVVIGIIIVSLLIK